MFCTPHLERNPPASLEHVGLMHPAQVVALARDLLAGLQRSAADSFTVIFGDSAAAASAEGGGGLSNAVVAVDPAAGSRLAGPLLIVGATQQQVIYLFILTRLNSLVHAGAIVVGSMPVGRRSSPPQRLEILIVVLLTPIVTAFAPAGGRCAGDAVRVAGHLCGDAERHLGCGGRH
jgi:hypothetical protein